MDRRRSDSEVKGAQVGDRNTQHNTYLPPTGQSAAHASDDAQTTSITTGNNATVTNTQKHTNLKFNIPVIGPLLSMAAMHPVLAVATTVVVVSSASVAGGTALSGSNDSGTPTIVRGFQLKASVNGSAPPIGYDFAQTPPAIAGTQVDAVYNEGSSLLSTSGKLAGWSGATVPTAAECLAAVRDHPSRNVAAYLQSLICYVDRNGNPGYILITGYASQFLTRHHTSEVSDPKRLDGRCLLTTVRSERQSDER